MLAAFFGDHELGEPDPFANNDNATSTLATTPPIRILLRRLGQ